MPTPVHPTGSTPPSEHDPHAKGLKPSGGGEGFGTLDDLKNYFISKMGDKDGKKMYTNFLNSLVFAMMTEIKQSGQRATEAIKRERQQQ